MDRTKNFGYKSKKVDLNFEQKLFQEIKFSLSTRLFYEKIETILQHQLDNKNKGRLFRPICTSF